MAAFARSHRTMGTTGATRPRRLMSVYTESCTRVWPTGRRRPDASPSFASRALIRHPPVGLPATSVESVGAGRLSTVVHPVPNSHQLDAGTK